MSRRLTPAGESALAVVAVGGARAIERLRACVRGRLPRSGKLRVVELELSGVRERAVVAGIDDRFEVSIHGNPLLVDALLAEIGGTSGPAASLEQEILAAATRAASRVGVRWCLWQRGERGLVGLARAIEQRAGPELRPRVREALVNGDWLRRHIDPPRLVLRGRTNAGKSTLFNLLVGRERVRTGPQERLTRDPIDEVVLVGSTPFRLVDTAGESDAAEGLDADAIDRARAAEAGAELTVWVCSLAEAAPREAMVPGAIRVWTHADRAAERGPEPGFVLVASEESVRVATRTAITELLANKLARFTNEPELGPAWVDERQREWLCSVGV